MIHFLNVMEKVQPNLKIGLPKQVTYTNFDVMQAVVALLQRKPNAENLVKRALKSYSEIYKRLDIENNTNLAAEIYDKIWERVISSSNNELKEVAWNDVLYLIGTSSESQNHYSLFEKIFLLIIGAQKQGIKIDKM